MTVHISVNMGDWDDSIHEFQTRSAAEIYLRQLTPLTRLPLEIKDEKEMRFIRSLFIEDDICVDLVIEKGEVYC